MFRRLRYFEPPETTDPDWRFTAIASILRRANAQLGDRDADEIQYMLDSIRYLLSEGLTTFHSSVSNEPINMSPALIIRMHMENVDLSDQSDLPNASWPEYFASLAIGLCEQAIVHEEEHLSPKPHMKTFDSPKLRLDSELISHATEAVVTAEVIATYSKTLKAHSEIRERVRMNAQKAAIAKWSDSREIKDKFVSEFRKGVLDPNSVRNSATKFYKGLSKADRKVLCPSDIDTNAVRTLTEYMTAQNRNRSSDEKES